MAVRGYLLFSRNRHVVKNVFILGVNWEKLYIINCFLVSEFFLFDSFRNYIVDKKLLDLVYFAKKVFDRVRRVL